MYIIGEYAVCVALIITLSTLLFGVCAVLLTISQRVEARVHAPRKNQRE